MDHYNCNIYGGLLRVIEYIFNHCINFRIFIDLVSIPCKPEGFLKKPGNLLMIPKKFIPGNLLMISKKFKPRK